MAHPHTTPGAVPLEEALTTLFCLLDDAYAAVNPGGGRYESLKRLSDSEVLALALFQQLRGISRAKGPSCATRRGSSRTCFRAWRGSTPLRSTAGSAGCAAFWSPCGARCWRSSWEIPRPSWWTRGGLVRPRRLPAPGSTFMNTTVSPSEHEEARLRGGPVA